MKPKRALFSLLTACLLAAAASPLSAQEYQVIDLGTLGGVHGQAHGISEGGLVVGWATLPSGVKHAAMWDPIGIVDLGAPAEFTVSSAHAVNDAREVAARGEGDPQSYRGYRWASESWTPASP